MTPTPVSQWWDPDGHIDQCSWCALVMAANKAGAGLPASLAQSKVFGEHAAGIADLNVALQRELGWAGREYAGTFAGFLALLVPGMGAVCQGFYAALPDHYARFDPAFAKKGLDSVHDVYVQRQPDGSLWWIDPLFHSEPGYRGEAISQATLGAFMTAYHSGAKALLVLEGSHVPAQGGANIGGGADMRFVKASGYDVDSGKRLAVKAGAAWKYLDGSAGGTFSGAMNLVTLGVGDANAGQYVCLVPTGIPYADGSTRPTLVLVASSASTTAVPAAPPVDCTAAVATAVAPLEAQIAAFPTQLANARAAGREKQHEVDAAAVTAAPTV